MKLTIIRKCIRLSGRVPVARLLQQENNLGILEIPEIILIFSCKEVLIGVLVIVFDV